MATKTNGRHTLASDQGVELSHEGAEASATRDQDLRSVVAGLEHETAWLRRREGRHLIFGAFAVLLAGAALLAVAFKLDGDRTGPAASDSSVSPPAPVGDYIANYAPGPSADDPAARGIEFEPYRRPDPTLPAVPAGPVKKFRLDVFEHVTKVAADKAPTRVWSYGVNGKLHRGTGVSAPIVVNEGDRVEMTLVNGASRKMSVKFPHSIDFHSSEVAPNAAFKTIPPGATHRFSFVAKHPGVFMYHCATQPVLMHTGAGMVGAMIVKPRNLAPADRELWMTQQEYYIGEPGKDADMGKMEAKNPSVIAFNGYAAQYKDRPIKVKRGERIRMYVLNAGPSIWSGFHVIGTVFDRTVVEGAVGRHAQTINLAPSQGGWVEFTLDREGAYPFVTHAFGDMVRGAVGVLSTAGARRRKAEPATRSAGSGNVVNVELGEMYVKPSIRSVPAGRVTFVARNAGRIEHELMIERMPIRFDVPGRPTEEAAMGMIEDVMPMHAGRMSLRLRPGRYQLFCNLPGHYAAGQHTPFTVTRRS